MYSGARGLVASLWQVEDRAAARTMEAFYRGWLREGLPPARALREAKLALRRGEVELGPARGVAGSAESKPAPAALDSGHPFFWAPFIHIGLPGGPKR
jgi:CHAT domain-containing protein